MAKDILLYGRIDQWNALFFNEQVNEATEDSPTEELITRINSEGGDPDYMMSIAEQINQFADQMSIKAGNQLHSAAFFLCLYIPKDRIQCLDTTKAVVHRAAYPEWYETASWFEGSVQQTLMTSTNKDLEKAFRARVDVEAFENLPQMKNNEYTVKSIFALDTRVEVVLSGSDLRKIGLVGKVNKITPVASAMLDKQAADFKKCTSLEELKMAAQSITKSATTTQTPEQPKNKIMTLEELKAQHPAIYAAAKAEGTAEGIAAEKDRVEAIMVYNDVAPEICKAAIESGKDLSKKQIAEIGLKAMKASSLKDVEDDSAAAINTATPATPKTEKEKVVSEFEAAVDKNLKKG